MAHSPASRLRPALLAAAAAAVAAFALAAPGRAEEVECGCLAHRLERAALRPPGEGRGGAFDPANGRDHRNFPPDPMVDYRAMRLSLRFDRLEDRRFTGLQRLEIAPIGVPVPMLALRADGLAIERVTLDGSPVEWTLDGDALLLRFAEPLVRPASGDPPSRVLEIAYSGDRPIDGLTFSPATPELPGIAPARGPEVHTQGQTETNHFWFPIHDFPNVRMPTELVVDVPEGLQASANGRLVAQRTEAGRSVWHWNQERSHVPYLVSLVIGDFDRVELPNPLSKVPMAVWAPKGLAADAKATYANTDRMMKVFGDRFGVPYPWARYDQLVVRNFGAGGMENTTVTTMQPTAVLDAVALAEGDLDGLISHELCHQWTGDYLTCRSWEHIWLNEGWATYGTALWFEERDGPDGYWDSVLGNAGVAERDVADAPQPMCSPVYASAGETFRRPANPYPKGASILHMLRRMLGDEVFFAGVRRYMRAHALGLVETFDFRRALEAESGRSLEWFFDQWCFRPGSPRVKVTLGYDPAGRTLRVSAEQTQAMSERTPAMRISIPVWVRTAAGDVVVPLEMRERTATVTAALPAAPTAAWVDPWLEALKVLEVEQPEAWTLGALREAPTLAARRQALKALGRTETPAARAAVLETARHDGLRHTIRADAVGVLARWKSPEAQEAILALSRSEVSDPRVRRAIVGALESCPKAEAVARCTRVLAPAAGEPAEPSYAVRAEAIDVLRAHESRESLDLVRAQLSVPSHSDVIRRSALAFLAKFGDASDLPRVQALAALGVPDRLRPAAMDAMASIGARVGEQERAEAVRFLVAALDDPEEGPARAAGSALAEMKSKDGLARMRAMAAHDRDPARRRRAEEWVKRIAG
jgi:aminopeptidase N